MIDRYWVEGAINGGPLGSSTRFFLYDSLGNSHISGTTSAQFIRDLGRAPVGPVEVHLDSTGGSALGALEIFDALQKRPGGVVTYVDGQARSGASILLQAGTIRRMHREAAIEVHRPYVADRDMPKDAATRRAVRNKLDEIERFMANTYSARSDFTPAQWHKMMAANTVFDAENAFRAGLVDDIFGIGVCDIPPMVSLHRELETAGVLR